MQKKILNIIIIIICLSGVLKAQELKDYNLYNQNPLLYNPSMSVGKDYLMAYINSHLQWVDFNGTPKNNELGAVISFLPNMGAGFSVSNFRSGLLTYTKANLKYAYKIDFDETHYLKMGLSFGLSFDRIMSENAVNVDFTDIKLSEDYYNKTAFVSGLGLMYNYRNFDAQFIMPQLFEYKSANIYSIAIFGYNYQINDVWSIKPSVLLRGAKAAPFQFDGNLSASWNNTFWGQMAFRSSKSFIFSLGYNYKNYSIGYAYQAETRPISTTNNGSHEIQVLYRFNKNEKIPLKVNIFGNVYDSKDKTPLNAKIIVFEQDTKIAEFSSTKENGFYQIEVYPEKTYSFEVSCNEYYPAKDFVNVDITQTEIQKDFFLKPQKTYIFGNVTNLYTKEPISSEIVIMENNKIIDTINSNTLGNYSTTLNQQRDYNFKISSKNYESQTYPVKILDEEQKNINFELKPLLILTGTVTDIKTKKPIGVNLELYDIANNKSIGNFKSDSVSGKYEIQIKDVDTLTITATSPEYMFYTEIINIDKSVLITQKDIALQPIELGATVILKNVNFDFNKSDLRDESLPEINRLISIMKQYPKIKVEISGHTDNIGVSQYNKKLSQARAQSVVNYMVQNGISKDRLIAVGYGDEKPIATNYTEEGRQENRRVEAKIIAQ